MESFDESLKYLLQHAPADFVGFGLQDPTVRILEAVPSVLPSRKRDIDGAYLITLGPPPSPGEAQRIVHIELYRRHQGLAELGTDIAEAQVRLFRREGKLITSHLWDLYGDQDAPVREKRSFQFGADGSVCCYLRINLRGMTWQQLLSEAPPALWALVALTRDGATVEVIEKARDTIDAHGVWSPSERADHRAVLWFVSESEGVPVRRMKELISKEKLMESELWKEIYGDGRARGKAEDILAVLAARGIPVSDTIQARILGCTDIGTLDAWIRRAVVASTAAAVVRAKARPAAKT